MSWQRGLITSAQLRDNGLTYHAVRWRVVRGALLHIDRGLYCSPHVPKSWDQLAVAACLLNGPDAALSHLSAARVWGFAISRSRREKVEVTVPHYRPPRTHHGQIVVHQSRRFTARDRVTCGEHRVTTKIRTIFDLASTMTEVALKRVVDAALADRLVTRDDLIKAVELCRGGRAKGVLTSVLGPYRDQTTPQSVPEADFFRLLADAGIPRPICQFEIRDGDRLLGRVDFAWPEYRVALEIDGYRHHSSPDAHAHDSRRETAIRANDWLVGRTTPKEVEQTPELVMVALRALLRRAGWRIAS